MKARMILFAESDFYCTPLPDKLMRPTADMLPVIYLQRLGVACEAGRSAILPREVK